MVLIYQGPTPCQCSTSTFPTDDPPGTIRACPDCGKTWKLEPGWLTSRGFWMKETRSERWKRKLGVWVKWQRAKWRNRWKRRSSNA